MFLIILHLSFIKFFKYLFYSFDDRERKARDNKEKNKMCERERQMDRNSKIAVEKDAGGRKRYGFLSPWIFYLPSVSHSCKQEI